MVDQRPNMPFRRVVRFQRESSNCFVKLLYSLASCLYDHHPREHGTHGFSEVSKSIGSLVSYRGSILVAQAR